MMNSNIILKTPHLNLVEHDTNTFSINICSSSETVKIASIENSSDLGTHMCTESSNLQDYIVTWELYQEFIRLVDEAYDILAPRRSR